MTPEMSSGVTILQFSTQIVSLHLKYSMYKTIDNSYFASQKIKHKNDF